MRQRETLNCETCARFRRLDGWYTADRERKPQSTDPLIPCKVGLCTIGGAGSQCSTCGRWHDGPLVGAVVRCEGCGLSVRLEPIRFVLPWGSCKQYVAARIDC